MGLFRRKQPTPQQVVVAQQSAIEGFWVWWSAEGASGTAAAIDEGNPARMVEPISSRVRAIDDRLGWELGPGRSSQHVLVVSPEGNPEVRAAARRWLLAAPGGDDPTWEYADARRRGSCDGSIELGSTAVGFADVVVGVRRVGSHLDVAVHHPVFATVSQDVRQQVTFLALDEAVGETAVETWIGEVSCPTVAPIDAFPLRHLASLVDDLEASHRDESGEPTWNLLRGDGPQGPVMAMAQVPLSATVAPELDHWVGVHLPFTDRTDEGFPGEGSLEPLRSLEDHVSQRLGSQGRLVAHETSAGHRTLHFYVDSTGPGAEVIRAATTGWAQGRVAVEDGSDPGWRTVAHLRT